MQELPAAFPGCKNNRVRNLPAPQMVISSHAEGAPSGSCSRTSAQERCQSCLLPGTWTFKHMQPGIDVVGKGSRQGCRHKTEQARARTRRGKSSDFSHQKWGLTCPSKERGASPGDPVYPVAVTERVSHPCKGLLSFLLVLEGATGITATLHVEAWSWRQVESRWRGHSHSASSIYSTKSKG